jgi:hypothetical protein
METEEIIWRDGHVSTIANEEAIRIRYEYPNGEDWEWRIKVHISNIAIRDVSAYLLQMR